MDATKPTPSPAKHRADTLTVEALRDELACLPSTAEVLVEGCDCLQRATAATLMDPAEFLSDKVTVLIESKVL